MPRSSSIFAAVVLGLALVGAVGASAERPRVAWVDGQWRAVATAVGGTGSPTMTIKDDRLRFEFDPGFGMQFYFESRITGVDTGQNPAHLDLVFEDTNLPAEFDDASEYLGQPIKAIYRVDGDLITIATGEPGSGRRPKSFASTEDQPTQVFSGRRAEGHDRLTMDSDFPADLAGVWEAFEPLVMNIDDGLLEIRYRHADHPFEQHELVGLVYNAEGAGRMATIVLDTENRGMIGRTAISRVEFDGPDRMVSSLYPMGHEAFGKWPESADPDNAPEGLMVVTWERIK